MIPIRVRNSIKENLAKDGVCSSLRKLRVRSVAILGDYENDSKTTESRYKRAPIA